MTAERPAFSIVSRLTGWLMISCFVLVFLATSYLYWSLTRALTTENNAILQDRIRTITAILNRPSGALGAARARVESEWASRHFERTWVKIVAADGSALVASPAIPPEVETEVFSKSPSFSQARAVPNAIRVRTETGGYYLTLSEKLTPSATGAVAVFAALDLENENLILTQYKFRLIAVLGVTILMSTLLGRSIAKSALAPLRDMIETAARIHSSTLHERIAEGDLPVELRDLANTINTMLNRLEDSFERLSRFSSDIAHELRTPLNNIRGEIEVALGRNRTVQDYGEVLTSCLEEVERISKVIESLMFLAKTENPETQIQREKISLMKELRNVIELYEVSAADEGIRLELVSKDDLEIEVERTLFQRAIGNILANAIDHTPKGGSIRVETEKLPHKIRIHVRDTGEGIAKADLPRVFDRFYRTDPSRRTTKLGGFGLGLSIVKAITTLHRGEIVVESELGKGTDVCLVFPT